MRVKDINPGPGGSDPFRFTVFGLTVLDTALYFSADDGTGPELWRTDGTEGGTVRVKDINPSTGSLVSELTVFGAALYFSADDGVSGPELWKSDGTEAGTVRVKDINTAPGAGSAPNALTVFNNALYFSADDGVSGRELWKSDGTDAGTMRVKDICPGSCSGLPFLVILSVRNEALRPTNH
jgi:ELWxxDGT repeat protein